MQLQLKLPFQLHKTIRKQQLKIPKNDKNFLQNGKLKKDEKIEKERDGQTKRDRNGLQLNSVSANVIKLFRLLSFHVSVIC